MKLLSKEARNYLIQNIN